MAKFKLQPAPTFTAPVDIPVPGDGFSKVVFTFKYRDRQQMKTFLDRIAKPDEPITDAEMIEDMCSGWELTDPFTRESIDLLVLNYIGATSAIFDKYLEEHTKARAKN
jgi:hypothetical protein